MGKQLLVYVLLWQPCFLDEAKYFVCSPCRIHSDMSGEILICLCYILKFSQIYYAYGLKFHECLSGWPIK